MPNFFDHASAGSATAAARPVRCTTKVLLPRTRYLSQQLVSFLIRGTFLCSDTRRDHDPIIRREYPRLKEFSRPSEVRSDADLNRAIEAVVQVSGSAWRDVAEVTLALDEGVGFVSCYESELKQALLNMVINAAQAISGQEDRLREGRIIISTARTEQGVRISVQDNGHGMSQEVQQRIFDLFFTTKPFGEGSGQGLALAHNTIVKKHGGTLDVDSHPGVGTTFTITLPDQPRGSTPPTAPEPALTFPTE
jgi:signal transduction histidine kinase